MPIARKIRNESRPEAISHVATTSNTRGPASVTNQISQNPRNESLGGRSIPAQSVLRQRTSYTGRINDFSLIDWFVQITSDLDQRAKSSRDTRQRVWIRTFEGVLRTHVCPWISEDRRNRLKFANVLKHLSIFLIVEKFSKQLSKVSIIFE